MGGLRPDTGHDRQVSGVRWPVRGVLLGAVILGLSALGCAVGAPASNGEVESPKFAAIDLESGGMVSTADIESRFVLMNGWATWCKPCREEMPFLAGLQDEFGGDGLQVVGVNVDDAAASSDIARFLDDAGVNFPTLVDSRNRFSRAYRTSGVPESVLLDQNRRVIHRWKGPLDVRPAQTRSVLRDAVAGRAGETAVDGGPSLGLGVAVLAGFLSFLSPCVLPVVPGYLAVVGGLGSSQLNKAGDNLKVKNRVRGLSGAGFFVAGFTAVFIALGASASWAGSLLRDYELWITRAGGVVVIILALHLLKIFRLPMLMREFRAIRWVPKNTLGRSTGAFLIGVAFAAGWTPCIGPVLAGILTLASTEGSAAQGMTMLGGYSAGLAIPFLAAAMAMETFLQFSEATRRYLPRIERTSGALLLLVGALLLSGSLSRASNWLQEIF